MINIIKNTIEIGLEKPLKILHITDSHLPFYCESDTEDIPEIIGDITEPTDATGAFYEYVTSEPQIKAVLTGHLHLAYESRLPGGTMQYVTDRGDRGNAREITII